MSMREFAGLAEYHPSQAQPLIKETLESLDDDRHDDYDEDDDQMLQ